jgi:hypothetical protein
VFGTQLKRHQVVGIVLLEETLATGCVSRVRPRSQHDSAMVRRTRSERRTIVDLFQVRHKKKRVSTGSSVDEIAANDSPSSSPHP